MKTTKLEPATHKSTLTPQDVREALQTLIYNDTPEEELDYPVTGEQIVSFDLMADGSMIVYWSN